jgi:SAM-dependent methyltransferase
MADALFEDPRLARVYDPLDPDRSDLHVYAAIVDEFGARSVLDIGCGTGTFACALAERGIEVTGVDPAPASLDVAQAKPGAGRVRWMRREAADLPPLQVDLATMTGNVAQVFLTDAEWDSVLRSAHAAVRPGGRLVFETRDPAAKAWREWRGLAGARRRPRDWRGRSVGRGVRSSRRPGVVPFQLRVRGGPRDPDLGVDTALPAARGGRGFPAIGRLPAR